MTVDPAANRFEAAFQFISARWKRWLIKAVLVLAATEMVLEILFIGVVHLRGKDFRPIAAQLVFARMVFGPTPDARHALTQIDHLDAYDPRSWAFWSIPDGLLGFRAAPSTSFSLGTAGEDRHEDWMVSNSQGFIVPATPDRAYAVLKPANVFRVIVLGGSTVLGQGAASPAGALPAILEHRLRDRSGPSVEVINGGVLAYTTAREYLWLLSELGRYSPDLVIAYDGWNDAVQFPSVASADPAKLLTPFRMPDNLVNNALLSDGYSLAGSLRRTVQLAVLTASNRFRITINRLAPVVAVRMFGMSGLTFIPQPAIQTASTMLSEKEPSPEALAKAAQIHIDNVERMALLARQGGYGFAHFLQPLAEVDGKPHTTHELRQLEGQTRYRGQITGFYQQVRPLTIELARRLPGACIRDISTEAFAGVTETVYSDTGHLNEAGNEMVVAVILHRLAGCGLIPPERR